MGVIDVEDNPCAAARDERIHLRVAALEDVVDEVKRRTVETQRDNETIVGLAKMYEHLATMEYWIDQMKRDHANLKDCCAEGMQTAAETQRVHGLLLKCLVEKSMSPVPSPIMPGPRCKCLNVSMPSGLQCELATCDPRLGMTCLLTNKDEMMSRCAKIETRVAHISDQLQAKLVEFEEQRVEKETLEGISNLGTLLEAIRDKTGTRLAKIGDKNIDMGTRIEKIEKKITFLARHVFSGQSSPVKSKKTAEELEDETEK